MKIRFERNKTSTVIVMYSLYLYFLGLSLRNTSNALEPFKDQKRSYVSIWNWIQRFGSYSVYKRKRTSAFIIDETGVMQYFKDRTDSFNDYYPCLYLVTYIIFTIIIKLLIDRVFSKYFIIS